MALDEELLRRLPLPVAQLCRAADNAKNVLDRHCGAFYVWEASLKLLGSVAIVELAGRGTPAGELQELLQSLSRPSLGHWWGYVRTLTKVLAPEDAGFRGVQKLLLGKTRNDLPRCAGLDAALREALEPGVSARQSTVRLSELCDRLVRYRNQELGHGAVGRREPEFYRRMGDALLAAGGELLGKLDLLAGRRLLFVSDVRRQAAGSWLVEQYELQGENARRLVSVEVPEGEESRLPRPDRVYLAAKGQPEELLPQLEPLHPLLLFELDSARVFFLNAQRSQRQADYLCYRTGETVKRPELGQDQRELLGAVLGRSVDAAAANQWAALSYAEEQPEGVSGETPLTGEPRRIGEFELLSRIGRGGMGVVYRAWQPSLGRQVALKCLLRSGDPKAEARFAREIRALGRVEHPGLVKVFTSGSSGDQWFYAMELVDGADLGKVCEQLAASSSAGELGPEAWQRAVSTAWQSARSAEEPLGPDDPPRPAPNPSAVTAAAPTKSGVRGRGYVQQVVELIVQVAESLHALHEAGVIHRDVKPGNIMLSADGKQAVLMDLGLAQLADDVEGRLTRTRQFVGTLRYASPEQERAVGELDRRTDIYSLGATLWELLTLRPLYGATDEMPTADVIAKIQREDPDSIRVHNPQAPKDLAAIVQKCLEKDRAQRYGTAQELATELRRVLTGEPVSARPIGQFEKFRRWCGRNPVLAGSALTIALVLLVSSVVSTAFGLYAQRQATIAWEAEQNERQQRERADRKTDEAEKSANVAIEQTKQATLAAAAAREAEEKEQQQRELAERILYAQRIKQAYAAWNANSVHAAYELLDATPPRFRGWEYSFLDNLFHRGQLTLSGFTNQRTKSPYGPPALSVAFSPDGTRLAAAGSGDHAIKLWNVVTGEELLAIPGIGQYSVAFSADGKFLASGGFGQIKVWDSVSGKEWLTFRGPAGEATSVAYSADGSRLASAFSINTLPLGATGHAIKVWNVKDGEEVLTLCGHTGPIHDVAFSPDGTQLISSSYDNMVKIWDASTGKELRTLLHASQTTLGMVYGVAFSPDGTQIASGSVDSTIKLWRTATGEEIRTLRGHTAGVSSVAFSPDGRTLASGAGKLGSRGELKLWDVATGREMQSLRGHRTFVRSVAFSPDGTRLASSSQDGAVTLWHVTTGQNELALRGHTNLVSRIKISPDGKQIVSGSYDKSIKVWDMVTGNEVRTFRSDASEIPVALNSNGTKMATVGTGAKGTGEIHIRDFATDRDLYTLPSPIEAYQYRDAAFSPDGTLLISAGGPMAFSGDELKIWNVSTGQDSLTLRGHTNWIKSVTFSPNGTQIASASWDKSVRVWDATIGRVTLTIEGHMGLVHGVAFSPDGEWLASCGAGTNGSGEIKLWQAVSGKELRRFRGHSNIVNSVAFSRDGTRLASCSDDSTVMLWDTTTGEELLTLGGHSGQVLSIMFSKGDEWLASGGGTSGNPGEITLWDARPLSDRVKTEYSALNVARVVAAKVSTESDALESIRSLRAISDEVREKAMQIIPKFFRKTPE